MKNMRAIVAAVTMSCVHVGTAAQECQMEIREGSAARDLGRVLSCFDERLKAVESRLDASGSGSSAAITERNNATFDAGDFSVTVRSAIRDDQRGRVNILLSIRNKTTVDIYLGYLVGSNIITDEATGMSAEKFLVSGLNFNANRQEDYTSVPAGATISVTLSPESSRIVGPDVSARIVLTQFVRGNERRVTVPLSFKIRR